MSRILHVDDEKANRALVRAYLEGSSVEVIDAESGEEALAFLEQEEPDLVLLDVLMPGVDGLTVARRIKETPRRLFLPVILVTALTDQRSRRAGLEAGADDFLSKPLDPQELGARIGNLLALREKERALVERNRELSELHRFKAELSALLVHDMQSPLAVSIACVEFALSHCSCVGDVRDSLEDASDAGRRLQAMIADLLEVDRLESARITPTTTTFELGPWVARQTQPRRWDAARRRISLEVDIPPRAHVVFDQVLLARVLDNLLDNALRYTPTGGRIAIRASARDDGVLELRVGNSGESIPASQRSTFFEKYAQAEGRRSNFGFGLYFCRLALRAHERRIWIEESDDLPTVFVVELTQARASIAPASRASGAARGAEG